MGECGLGTDVLISSVGPHFGEEPELVGYRGSGTIFFAGCNLACQFCQNWDISQARQGHPATIEELAGYMMEIQKIGCHNLNLVTPTPYTPSILQALRIAKDQGLTIPVVYNCGGYESLQCLALCEGLIEIYMPDAKYSDDRLAENFSHAPGYPQVNRAALQEMHHQVGDLAVNGGIALSGLLVRHLVLPNYPDNTRGVLEFIAAELSPNTYVNVMDQYRPCYHADTLPGLDLPLDYSEYEEALSTARSLGLHRGF